MRYGRLAALLFLISIVSCTDPAAAGGGGGVDPNTVTVNDPIGDTFGPAGVRWDLSAMTITRDDAGITVVLDFATAPISPVTGDTDAMVAFVDFDTDQDSTTGIQATADRFRQTPGSTGVGADYQLAMTTYNADSMVKILDHEGVATGLVKPVFSGKRVTIRIPKAFLGNDDGYLNAVAIVGRSIRPSDVVPENGAVSLKP